MLNNQSKDKIMTYENNKNGLLLRSGKTFWVARPTIEAAKSILKSTHTKYGLPIDHLKIYRLYSRSDGILGYIIAENIPRYTFGEAGIEAERV